MSRHPRSGCATPSPRRSPRRDGARRRARPRAQWHASPTERSERAPAHHVAGQPVIRVVGVGGGGVNAVNRMVEAEVEGVEFIAVNTDVQSLQQSTADLTLHIGAELTRGLGVGLGPEHRPPGGDGGLRPHEGPAEGLGHDLHRRRLRRRHRHRRGARRRAHRARSRRADRRHRHEAVRLRGHAPQRTGRARRRRRSRRRSTR